MQDDGVAPTVASRHYRAAVLSKAANGRRPLLAATGIARSASAHELLAAPPHPAEHVRRHDHRGAAPTDRAFLRGWEIVSSIRHVVVCSLVSRSLPTRRFIPSSSPIPT